MAEPSSASTAVAAKRARLLRLRHRMPHMSGRALRAVINEFRREPLPADAEGLGYNSLRQTRDYFAKTSTPYGTLHKIVNIPTSAGGTLTVEIADPLAMLHYSAKHSIALSSLLDRSVQRTPPSPARPWRCMMYADEITPGNPLLSDNLRKTWAVYYSFLEFGLGALCDEEAWFTPIVIRSTTVQKLQAGMASVFCSLLRAMFNPEGHDARTAGVQLELCLAHQPAMRLWWTFAGNVSDEDALRQIWRVKGATGIRNCMLCMNIVQYKHRCDQDPLPLHDRTGMLLPHTTADPDKFKLHTKASILRTIDAVAAAKHVSKPHMELQEKALGWLEPTGSMLRDAIAQSVADPSQQAIYDPAHCFLIHGAFNIEFGLLMNALKAHDVSYATFHGFVRLWKWPLHVGAKGKVALAVSSLGPKRAAKHMDHNSYGATASESLTIYAVCALFVRQSIEPSGVCPAECASFLLLCAVLDMVVATARGTVSPDALKKATKDWLEAHILAYGEDNMTPKFHYAAHMHVFLRRFGLLVWCLTHERKHRMVKRFINDARLMVDSHMLRECTAHHAQMLQSESLFGLHIGLVKPRPAKGALLQWLQDLTQGVPCPQDGLCTSQSARYCEFGTFGVGDVILTKMGTAARVEFIASVAFAHEEFALVRVFHFVQQRHRTYSQWRSSPETHDIIYFHEIEDTLVWSESGEIITVLHPHGVQSLMPCT